MSGWETRSALRAGWAAVRANPLGSATTLFFVCGTVVLRGGVGLSDSVSRHWRQEAWTIGMALFFLLLLIRLGITAFRDSSRRGALLLLLGAILCWAGGSVSVSATSISELTHFPAPGEWLFLASYAGLAGYLARDVNRRVARALSGWLDVFVIGGGTACLTTLLLLTPVAVASGSHGASLLLALLYPIMDLALAVLVVAQVVLRARGGFRHSLPLFAGLLLLAGADSSFVLQVSSSTYSFSSPNDVLWGTSFLLIVSSACRPRPPAEAVPRVQGPALMLGAAITAVVALTLRPSSDLGPYIAAIAVLTLWAAGARLAVALRQANRAAEAFALSETDDLTKLPNRRAVRQRLDEAIADKRPHGLMLLDLDGFKEINDTLGHAAGDTVLTLAALRMRECVPPGALVARLGGDEFAILMYDDDPLLLLETANLVLEELQKPLRVDGIEIIPSASIGVATSLSTDAAGNGLLRRADVAMYQAKSARRGTALYDADADEFSRSRLELAEALRKALGTEQMELWYQPQINASTGELCGLEALIRWRHPEEGILSPVAWLPVARRAGLMGLLSDVVAERAVRDVYRWRQAGLDVRVAINCAPPELLSGVFLPRLYSRLAEFDLPGDCFVLEVTEDSFLSEPNRARSILLEVREHGIQVAIDDYGTGFSSLAYLRDLPVHELKIDRSFVNVILTDPQSRMIVASTNQMAHGLKLRTVAEGVESPAIAAELVALGIDVLQGYHIAAPMPADEVQSWVRDWKTSTDLLTTGTSVAPAPAEAQQPGSPRERSSVPRSTRIRTGHRAVAPRLHEA